MKEEMKMMSFGEFTEKVAEEIRTFLPEQFEKADISLHVVTKNNDSKFTGLQIRTVDSNIAPTIYLEEFFRDYEHGRDMNTIMSQIARIRVENDARCDFDIEEFLKYENCSEKIVPRIVNREMNAGILQDRPYTVIADDLAVTYHIMMAVSEEHGIGSIQVTNGLMNDWGITVEELHQQSVHNLPILLPSSFKGMTEVLLEVLRKRGADEELDELASMFEAIPDDNLMYVLTNIYGSNGASALLDVEIMKSVSERFGTDFIILPSSIHEVIIVPSEGKSVQDLKAMVMEVNSTQVEPEERLSDSIYRYTAENGLVRI